MTLWKQRVIWQTPGFTSGITEQSLHQKSHYGEERETGVKRREPSV